MYGVLAFAVISQIVSLLRLNFGRDSQYPMSHSSYTNLYLDLIGFVFFMVGTLVVWRGYTFFKRFFIGH